MRVLRLPAAAPSPDRFKIRVISRIAFWLRMMSNRFASYTLTPWWAQDISEDENEYLIKAELPDVRKDDVRVTAEEGILTIMGERKFEKEESGKRYHRVERAYGSFGRTFSLPDDANPTKVSAEFKDGLLTLHLVKDEKTKPQHVEVKVAWVGAPEDWHNREKMSDVSRSKIDSALSEAKEALKGSSQAAAMKMASEKLNKTWQVVSAELYGVA